jgi:hypothetical protein
MAILSQQQRYLLVLVFILSVTNISIIDVVANVIVHDDVNDDTNTSYHNSHSILQSKAIPNSGDLMNNNDNDVLRPWYIDFLNLPSDSTFILLRSTPYIVKIYINDRC